jgi:O-antigen/teichoic acid export membrane protein
LPIHWRKILPNDTLSGLQFFQLFRYGSVFLISIILPRAGLLPDQVGIFEAFLFFAGVVSYFWVTGLIQALLPLASIEEEDRGTKKKTDGRKKDRETKKKIDGRKKDRQTKHPKQNLNSSAFRSSSSSSVYRSSSSSPVFRSSSSSPASREFFNAFLLLLLFSALAAGTLLLASPVLGRLLGQELPRGIIWLVVLYLVLFAPSTLVEYWYVITGHTKKLVRYGIVAFTLQIFLVGIPVILGFGVKGAIWGMIAAGGFRMTWILVILISNGEFRVSFPFWKKYLDLGTPIIMSVLLSGSAQYVNGFIVSAKFDPGMFAIFRYGARELPLVALLAHALSNAIVPSITRDGPAAGLKQLKERSSRMVSWMFPLTIGLVLLAYFLFPAVYGRNFLESAGVFNLFLLLITSRLLFPQTVLIAMKKTRILMTAAFFELIINVGLSLILVQLWGIRGVALATVIAYYFERAFLMTYTRVVMGIPARQYMDVRKHFSWSVILLIAYLLAELVIYPLIRG